MMSGSNDALNGARGIAIGILISAPLWLLIVGGVLLLYRCSG
jgi:hypothetical protein